MIISYESLTADQLIRSINFWNNVLKNEDWEPEHKIEIEITVHRLSKELNHRICLAYEGGLYEIRESP